MCSLDFPTQCAGAGGNSIGWYQTSMVIEEELLGNHKDNWLGHEMKDGVDGE